MADEIEEVEGELVDEDRGRAALDKMTVMPKHKGGRIDVLRRAAFLQELQRTPVAGRAARAVGLRLSAVMKLRETNPEFAAAWDEAITQSVDAVEQVLVEKALRGDGRSIEQVLKAYRPERYRERVEVGVAAQGIITVDLVPITQSTENKGMNSHEQSPDSECS